MIKSFRQEQAIASSHREGATTQDLLYRVRREIESYWYLYLSRFGLALLLSSTLVGAFISLLVIVALTSRVVEYNGPVIYGYISPVDYNLRIDGDQATYGYLDSVVVASRLLLLLTIVVLVYSVVGFITTLLAYRSSRRSMMTSRIVKSIKRHWTSFSILSPMGAGLIVLLLFSILRVLAYDIIPGLHRTIYLAPSTGRVFIYEPHIAYSWVITRLAWRPLVFFILFALTGVATSLSVLYVLFTPRIPVVKVARPRKVITRLRAR